MVDTNDKIMLAHGGGGQLSSDLIKKYVLPNLGNDTLNQLGDSAVLELDSGSICFTTDGYVVKPLFFNGGDIGKLAVCGTMNDLAVAGARPVALSLSLIIETGLELAILEKILKSIGETAKQNNIDIVTGDTKTVEAGSADKIFITTAGVGECAETDEKSDLRESPEPDRQGIRIVPDGKGHGLVPAGIHRWLLV